MQVITISKLRNNIKHYVELVTSSLETIIIPRGNDSEEAVVMMPLSEYNALMETNYLTSTKANQKRLEESIAQLREGNTVSFSIEELAAKLPPAHEH